MKIAIQTSIVFLGILMLVSLGLATTYKKMGQLRLAHEQILEEWEELSATLSLTDGINKILMTLSSVDEHSPEKMDEEASVLKTLISRFDENDDETSNEKHLVNPSHYALETRQYGILKNNFSLLLESMDNFKSPQDSPMIIKQLRIIEENLYILQLNDVNAMKEAIASSAENQRIIFNSIWLIFVLVILTITGAAVWFTIHIQKLSQQLILQEKLAAAGLMTQILAHEIRNPLGIIKSSASILKKEMNPHSQNDELAGYLIEECDRIDNLITQLGLLKQPDHTAFRKNPVADILQAVVTLASTTTEKLSITLDLTINDKSITINCDYDRIKQALLNIILNAVQASTKNSRILIKTDVWQKWCRITIQDSGQGIPPSVKKHLFEPFVTTKSTGTGLGLTIAKQIIHHHKGKLSIDSWTNKGTTVTIFLPIDK